MSTPIEIDRCRYCHRHIGDAFAGGPDDVAPGVCATCIDARIGVLMVGAARRVDDGMAWHDVKAWLRDAMLELGIAPHWVERSLNADYAAFLSIHSDDPNILDVKQATELGAALLIGKPLLIVVPTGRSLSAALRRAAEVVVDNWDPQDTDAQNRLAAAIRQLTGEG